MKMSKKIAVALSLFFAAGIFAQKMAVDNKSNLAVFESDGKFVAVKILQDSRCGIAEFTQSERGVYEFGESFVAKIKSDGSFESASGRRFVPQEDGLLESRKDGEKPQEDADSPEGESSKDERKWVYSGGHFPQLSFWLKEKRVFGAGM